MAKKGSFLSKFLTKLGSGLSPEAKLEDIEKCGITFTSQAVRDELIEALTPSEWRPALDYKSLMLRISGNSPQLTSFYEECIDGSGDYTQVLLSLAMLTRGALELTIVSEEYFTESTDHTSFCPARITFTCNGRTFQCNFNQEVSWFDLPLLGVLPALLAETDSYLLYFRVTTEDSVITIGCLTLEQIKRLASLKGMGSIVIFDQHLPVNGLTVL